MGKVFHKVSTTTEKILLLMDYLMSLRARENAGRHIWMEPEIVLTERAGNVWVNSQSF